MRRVICCDHNPCPDRPRWWLSRFEQRPWRCPQCGQWWMTEHHTTYADYDTGGHHDWKRIEPTS